MKRRLFILILLCTALLIAGTLYFFVATEKGLRVILDHVPGVTYTTVSGTLISPVELTDLQYQNDTLALQVSHITLDWRPFLLLHKTLSVRDVRVDGMVVETKSSVSSSPSSASSKGDFHLSLSFPINFHLKSVALSNITWKHDQKTVLALHQASFELLLKHNQLNVNGDWQTMLTLPDQASSPFNGHVVGIVKGDTIHFKSSYITYGANRLTIDGRVSQSTQLNWKLDVPSLAAFSSDLSGKLVSEGIMTGNVNAPTIRSKTMITNALWQTISIGDVSLASEMTYTRQKKLVMTGELGYLDKNPLKINANVDFKNSPSLAIINIKGENFKALDSEEYQLLLSPDVKVTIKQPMITITGRVDVNDAKLQPKDFSSTVTLPESVVIVTGKQNGKVMDPAVKPRDDNAALGADAKTQHKHKKTERWQTDMNIDITIQKALLAYAGLRAELNGAIKIMQSPGAALVAQGDLSVKQGAYTAYGQNLTIQEGSRVLFNGSLANPQLDIKATRHVNVNSADVSLPSYQRYLIVGVHVTGSVKKPSAALFSEPMLNQQDILSYLVFGYSQSQLSQSQTALVWQAVNALNVGGVGGASSGVQSSIRDTLGLSELGFENTSEYNPETGEMESGTSLVVGKKLSDRLSVSYSVGLLVPVNILYLRYQLSHHWALQSDSSLVGTGADILYTYSKD